MSNHAANVVKDHPHATSFATLIANIVNLIVSILFSFAIIPFAQQKVMSDKDITVFDVSLLSASSASKLALGISKILYIRSTDPGS